jgi:hypothetical protein
MRLRKNEDVPTRQRRGADAGGSPVVVPVVAVVVVVGSIGLLLP